MGFWFVLGPEPRDHLLVMETSFSRYGIKQVFLVKPPLVVITRIKIVQFQPSRRMTTRFEFHTSYGRLSRNYEIGKFKVPKDFPFSHRYVVPQVWTHATIPPLLIVHMFCLMALHLRTDNPLLLQYLRARPKLMILPPQVCTGRETG